MYPDDTQRPGGNTGSRNSGQPQYNGSAANYSPSTSYKYTNNNNSFSNGQQQPFRRNDRFKRDTPNPNERLIRQNDIIIRLLKDIRDRLPSPPQSEMEHTENASQNDDDFCHDDNPAQVMDESTKEDL